MKVCRQCGRRGFFLNLNANGLCERCESSNVRKEIDAAKDFIADFALRIKSATKQSVIFPGLGRDRIKQIEENCKYVREHINDWRRIPHFFDAFIETLEKEGQLSLYYSPLFPSQLIILDRLTEEKLEEHFEKLKRRVDKIYDDCLLKGPMAYDYSDIFTVAGVTFKNGRRSRQTILRQIRFGDPPYQREPEFRLEKYYFNDELAVAVYANQEQVGNIPKDEFPSLLSKWDDYYRVDEYDITGGGGLYYGLQLRVAFRKQNKDPSHPHAECAD